MTTLKTQFTQLREQYQIKQQVQSLEEVYDRYRTIRDGLLDVAEPLQKAQKKFEVIGMLPEPHSTIDFSQEAAGNDSNLLIVLYVQIMPDDFVMQLHRF